MKAVFALPQCFMLRTEKGLQLILGKIVDDFILAGTKEALHWFSRKTNQRFDVGTESYAATPLRFNGSIIEQDVHGSIKLSMLEFANSIAKLELPRERRKAPEAQTTPQELREYQSLAGKLNWLGHAAVPQYTFAASYLQQQLGDLRVKHLAQANGIMHEYQKLNPVLIFGRPKRIEKATLITFADAAFPKINGSVHGKPE